MRLPLTPASLALAGVFLPAAVWAACTSPAGVTGTIVFNDTSKTLQVCKGNSWSSLFKSSAGSTNCTSPAGVPGQTIYNSNYKVLQFCNGTGWANLGNSNVGGASGPCTSPAGPEGTVIYNTTTNTPQYCNGNDWVNAGNWASKAPFTPAAISTTQLWVRADSISLADGAEINALPDYSGKSHNLTNRPTNTQPSFRASVVNGFPGLDYDNDEDTLMYNGNFAVGGIVMLVKNNNASFANYDGLVGGPAEDSGNGHIFNSVGAGSTSVGAAVNTSFYTCHRNGTLASGCNMSPLNQPFIVAASTATPITTNSQIWLGDISGGGRAWRGQIMEAVITSTALTQQQREKLEGYLAWKYGLTASLPVSHPYKSIAP